MKRPNIVIINPDQMRADALGHLGNPASRTPYLDKFSKTEGVSFRNAFCQNTVCVPSRCSFFTGLYPHVNGHRTMTYMFHTGESSLLKELKAQGYYVWMNPRNDLLAAQEKGIFEEHASETFYGGDILPAPGAKENIRRGPDSKFFYSFYMGELETDEGGKNKTIDDESVDKAAEIIKNYDRNEPFCLFIGLQYPHPPYQIEEPYFSAIDKKKLPKRRIADEKQIATKPEILKRLKAAMRLDLLDEEDWNALRSCYLGMCMKVDDYFRKICEALKEKGIYDDTAIFFFSDHGDYTGDYGIVEKTQNTFEDCLTNVPLLIKPSKGVPVRPGISDSLVELVDFYATVLDMCGLEPVHSHYGKSLLPVLAQPDKKIRDYVFSEGGRLKGELHCDETNGREPHPFNPYYPRLKVQQDDVAHTKATMIRSEKYKYIRRLYEPDEFYDLVKDPMELDNCINAPEYREIIGKLRMEMLEWYQSTCDVVPYFQDQRFNEEMIWNRVKMLCPDEMKDDVQERIRNGAEMFTLIEELKKYQNSRRNEQQ